MSRNTPQNIQLYDTSLWGHIEILNNFTRGEVALCIQDVCIEILLQVGNYYQLPYDILRRSINTAYGIEYSIFAFKSLISCIKSWNIRKSHMKQRLVCYDSSASKWLIQQISGDHRFNKHTKFHVNFDPSPCLSMQMYAFKDPPLLCCKSTYRN